MSKELEALNDFVKELCFEKNVIHKHPTLHELKNDANYKTIEKGLKALQVIINIGELSVSIIQGNYYLIIGNDIGNARPITKETYEILKEVLKHE